jgi:hypothetical protein
MATATYDKIATTTLGSAAASITFSSIAASWTDLRLVFVGTTNTAGNGIVIRFNSDTATNYSQTYLYGSGSAAGAGAQTSVGYLYLATAALSTTVPELVTADIFSYAGSTYKTVLGTASQDLNGSGYVDMNVGLWRSTSAITTIALSDESGSFNTGTTATLYGIKAA